MEAKEKKLYKSRRTSRDLDAKRRWYRRIGSSMESANKLVTYRILGWLLCTRPLDKLLQLDEVNSILLIRNDGIGDMVLSSPVWKTLKRIKPTIRIGVVASFRNKELLQDDPDVDDVFELNDVTLKSLREAARSTRKANWDLVLPLVYGKKAKMAIICGILSPRSFCTMLLMKSTPPTARKRYSYLFSKIVEAPFDPRDIPIVDQYRHHLESTIALHIRDEEWKPSIHLSNSGRMEAWLEAVRESDGTNRSFLINLEARTRFRELGLEKSFELSQLLIATYNVSIVWSSSPSSRKEAAEFLENHPAKSIHLSTTESLKELVTVVRNSSLVITPDTSIIHIAAASGVPVVGLYPLWHEWMPYKIPNRVLIPEPRLPMDSISVGDICDKVRELITAASIQIPLR